ncbi:MAG: HAD family hydrolase, partial [Betaproteobacteria bacterium]|nr:HAD family hydrolase [Betaproteobacteria bacterium]
MVKLVLFDIDGTLVRTGHAGTQAFAKTFATEFNAKNGLDKMRFAGRTDFSLVREGFQHNDIPATPENFERFFERYTFWLDHILARSQTEICRGVWEMLRALQSLPR